jgi:hypothetical protein
VALVLANRVQETATPNTTVSFTLTGAVSGFQTFAVIGNTNTTYYSATDTAGNWEVGEGTYSTTGPTLTRTTVYASSNSGSAVTFPGTVNVFVTYPSGKSVNLDGAGNVSALGTVTSGTWQGSTVGVAYGGTGLTSYTLNGVVYASGTGTLATSSALTFDGTNLINSGAYTAPSNGSGAGTKTTIQGSTGTGQAGASGGNGFVEIIGGGGTSTWTSFGALSARRRGGIYLQAGTAQGDAGGTYVHGSTINIFGASGTNNGTTVGAGSTINIASGSTTKTDGLTSGASTISLGFANATVSSGVTLTAGIYGTSTGNNAGAGISVFGATAGAGGDIRLQPGLASASGSVSGKSYVTDPATGTSYEIITAKSAATPTVAGIVFGITDTAATGRTALGHHARAGCNAVAIGPYSGIYCGGPASSNAITIGVGTQAYNSFASVAIGSYTSANCAPYGVSIGYGAFVNAPNSIVINASGSPISASTSNQTHIAPIRSVCSTTGLTSLFYNACTKEVVQAAGGGGGVCCATPTVAGKVYGRTLCNGLGPTTQSTALGYLAGVNGQGSCTVAIGYNAAADCQGPGAVAVGAGAACTGQGSAAVAIGTSAGGNAQMACAVAVGSAAGSSQQSWAAVAVGPYAGNCLQGVGSIAIGNQAGLVTQGCTAVAIGFSAGSYSQLADAVAIGFNAGNFNQGWQAVAIGSGAGVCLQSCRAVAIGHAAGGVSQGVNSVAIGAYAGDISMPANSIAINATGASLVPTGVSRTHMAPIRNATTAYHLYYDPATGEITYG